MISSVEARRVGGEMGLSRSDLDFSEQTRGALPTFGAPHEAWLDTGRSALAVVARHLKSSSRLSTVWLPAYGCDSIEAPFVHQGLRTRFYGVGGQLEEIDADPRPGDTVLYIHYFGRRNRTALRRAGEFRSTGVWIIEDCVQAALTLNVGRDSDFALTSLRKVLPQPDGALLASREAIRVDLEPADEAAVSARVVGKLHRGAEAPPETFLPLFEQAEARLVCDRPRAISWLSRSLLARVDFESVATRRRSNYATLWQGLTGNTFSGVTPLLPALDDGEVPLGCPIMIDGNRRDLLRRHLAARGIFCPVHWDLFHVASDSFAGEHRLAESLLTLPLDQRYTSDDMTYILESISTYGKDRS